MSFAQRDIEFIKSQYPGRYHNFINVGLVTKVIDGDSLKIQIDSLGKETEVRLAGIDAPEYRQKYGIEAKRRVEDLVYFDWSVIVVLFFLDQHDRYISDVWTYPTRLIQTVLVGEGLAVTKTHPVMQLRLLLRQLQTDAKEAQLNHWSQKQIVTPKSFRREQRTQK